ncbi:helix-turn-helix domain-containing protein [Gracilibacillus sp. HCP3S3_G5_1]|uniref:helix-turn-helix domain-containing protein n=1 Tax=unclassified Gracilibacillus TaxID=2625209 RepID=UPI003F8A1C5F
MKITANLLGGNKQVFDSLQIGFIMVDKDDKVSYANQLAKDIIGFDEGIQKIPINALLEDASTMEVKQLYQPIEKHDRITKSGKSVVTRYSPYLSENGQLLGVLLFIEEFTTFQQRASNLTNIDLIQAVLQEIVVNSHTKFRVVLVDSNEEWLISDGWWDELEDLSPYAEKWIHKVAETAMEARRETREVYQDDTIMPSHIEVISKPIQTNGKLIGCVQFLNTSKLNKSEQELQIAKRIIRKLEKTYQLDDIIGESPGMKIVREQVKLYARLETPMLIRGEKGTGKYLVAKVIHALSDKHSHPFLRCNFSDLNKDGKFDKGLAYLEQKGKNGTVYFYINDILSVGQQQQLLDYVRKMTDTRVIFGTTLELIPDHWYTPFYELIQRYQIILPTLKERKEDMQLLVNTMLANFNRYYHTNIKRVDNEVIEYWKKCDWPGNIAQLEKKLENIVWRTDVSTDVITEKQLTEEEMENSNLSQTTSYGMSLQAAIDQFEKEYISESLKQHDFNKTKTAKALGVSVRNLYYKMDKYKIDRGAP